jgi:hypothetical protein
LVSGIPAGDGKIIDFFYSVHAGEIFPGRGIFTLINRVVRLIQPREEGGGGEGPPTSYPWEQKRLVNNSSPFSPIIP